MWEEGKKDKVKEIGSPDFIGNGPCYQIPKCKLNNLDETRDEQCSIKEQPRSRLDRRIQPKFYNEAQYFNGYGWLF